MKTTPSIQPTELDRAYLAGVIDGEGCISIAISSRRKPRGGYYAASVVLQVTVVNTDRRLIDWIAERWPGAIYINHRPVGNRRLAWRFTAATPGDVRTVLIAAMPYLVIKRVQAEIGMEMVETIALKGQHLSAPDMDRRLKLARHLGKLNWRGALPEGEADDDGNDPGGYSATIRVECADTLFDFPPSQSE